MRKRCLVALICCLTIMTSAWAQDTRMALVIGIGSYKSVPPLRNPPRDARAVGAKLRGLGFQTEVVIDPDRTALERAIRGFGDRARSADVALVYYAGHALEAAGENYLVPATADVHSARDIPFETVAMDLIPAQLEGGPRTVLLFVDACRDNPFQSRIAGGQRGIASRGLAVTSASATGTLIVYATAPGKVADDGTGDDSPFTTALLRHIDEPGLEIRQMLSRVRRDVRTATNGDQIPWESSSLEGDFYFRSPPPVKPTVVVPPAVVQPPPVVGRLPPAVVQPPQTAVQPPSAVGPLPPAVVQPPQTAVQPPATVACETPHFSGVTTAAGAIGRMRVVNSGTPCGVRMTAAGKLPFSRLSLTKAPEHGTVTPRRSGFLYTPKPGFVGSDEFFVDTEPSGKLHMLVTVLPPEALKR
jgi:hypothetical protein